MQILVGTLLWAVATVILVTVLGTGLRLNSAGTTGLLRNIWNVWLAIGGFLGAGDILCLYNLFSQEF
jgi:hypothetical protein